MAQADVDEGRSLTRFRGHGSGSVISQHVPAEPEYVSLRAAARIYAVSTYTLRLRIASGDLPAVKLGYKIIRVRIADLDGLFLAIPTTRPEDRYRGW